MEYLEADAGWFSLGASSPIPQTKAPEAWPPSATRLHPAELSAVTAGPKSLPLIPLLLRGMDISGYFWPKSNSLGSTLLVSTVWLCICVHF